MNSESVQLINADTVRNVCIIAHVDHGKTTLADSLISSNGLISRRLAGKMRYMDTREDEQIRGITMKTSAISLFYESINVNLIDSPGHVDFSGEVSSALFLSDVAILVVDVIEGVCSQTELWLRQAIGLDLDFILVLNKLDRLFIELQKSTFEIYFHIRCLIEQVNSCVGQIISGVLVEEENWQDVDKAEKERYFSVEKDNVIFASAVHGYGFTLSDFAKLWSPKLGIEVEILRHKLFTDSYLSKGIIKDGAERNGKKNLFEQLLLQPLYDIHKALMDKDLDKIKASAGKMNIAVKSRLIQDAFSEFMKTWLSLSNVCFRAIQKAQSPRFAFKKANRLSTILSNPNSHFCDVVRACDENGVTLIYIAKILSFDGKIIALCRILSGTVRCGDSLFVIKDNEEEHERVEISDLYLIVGHKKHHMQEAKAGLVCAIQIAGQFSSCTLCSEPIKENIKPLSHGLEPIVRVSLHLEGSENEWSKLHETLKQLSALDSTVRVIEQENGELTLLAAGEVHLQKCLTDLKDMGQENLKVSEPSVSFMETIVASTSSSTALDQQSAVCNIRDGEVILKLRAVPLPNDFVDLLRKNASALHSLRERKSDTDEVNKLHEILLKDGVRWLKKMKSTWWSKQSERYLRWLIERIWSFGPFRASNNLLINSLESYNGPTIWNRNFSRFRSFDQSIITGFYLAMTSGPLCEETMLGVAIIIESWEFKDDDPTIPGLLITGMKNTCRAAIEKQSLRLVCAMYKCTVNTNSIALGKVHAVLGKRRAKVIQDDMNQASGLFTVVSHLPVIESFSFCEHLRKATSGMATGQLEFSHWEILPEDPFWEPTTEDEIELFGTKADSSNRARHYVNALRKKKGLLTNELIVECPQKQRTLTRNR